MRSFPQRFLEMLPPRALGEIIDFIQSNGYNTTTIIRTGQKMPDALPVAFWPLDSYQNAESRQHALTTFAMFISSFEAQVTYGEESTENYWQVLSALRMGSNQDSVFKKAIADDDMFDGDESGDDASRFLSKEEMAALEATPGYKQASSAARKALKDNVDFLTEVREYGRLVLEMMERNQDRRGFIGSFATRTGNSVFGGDVNSDDVATARNEVRMLAGDVIGETSVSNDPAYTGGLGKFLKKGLKVFGSVAKFIPGLAGPARLLSMAQGLRRSKSQPQQQEPQGVEEQFEPMAQQASPLSLNQPEGRVLYGFARKYLAQAGGTGDTHVYGAGDILSVDDNGGVDAVAFPAIITPQGDVLEVVGNEYVPTEHTGGPVKRRKGRPRQVAVNQARVIAANLRSCVTQLKAMGLSDQQICQVGDLACNEVMAYQPYRSTGDVLEYTGSPDDEITSVPERSSNQWLDLGKSGLDFFTARENRKAAESGALIRPQTGGGFQIPGGSQEDRAINLMYDAMAGRYMPVPRGGYPNQPSDGLPPGGGVLLAGVQAAWAAVRKSLGGGFWKDAPSRVMARWNSKPHSLASKKFFGDTAIPDADGLGDM